MTGCRIKTITLHPDKPHPYLPRVFTKGSGDYFKQTTAYTWERITLLQYVRALR